VTQDLADLIERGDVQAVAEALRADPSLVSSRTHDGDTPLHIACWQKQIAIVGTLAAYGPDVNAIGAYGRTPLHYAVHGGRAISVPIVGVLLAMGANPTIRDGKGISVEDWAKIAMSDGLVDVLAMIRRWFEQHP
jgi:ankyrin repeat protein